MLSKLLSTSALLEHFLQAADDTGKTPLMLACRHEHDQTVKALISKNVYLKIYVLVLNYFKNFYTFSHLLLNLAFIYPYIILILGEEWRRTH